MHKHLRVPTIQESSHTPYKMVALVSDSAQRKGLSIVVMIPAAMSTVKVARVGVACAVIVKLSVVIRKPTRATLEFDPSTYLIYKMRTIVPSLILFAGVMTKTLTP